MKVQFLKIPKPKGCSAWLTKEQIGKHMLYYLNTVNKHFEITAHMTHHTILQYANFQQTCLL